MLTSCARVTGRERMGEYLGHGLACRRCAVPGDRRTLYGIVQCLHFGMKGPGLPGCVGVDQAVAFLLAGPGVAVPEAGPAAVVPAARSALAPNPDPYAAPAAPEAASGPAPAPVPDPAPSPGPAPGTVAGGRPRDVGAG
ncbi:hypothetical protein Slala05_84390 [Streptomyces lavendulae subsp. lavendulae]|nr:hypothetical protein Slala05_84390 [Streptomyces lavendulae subsp. lavendulae]